MHDVIDKIRLDLNKSKVRTSVSVCKGDTISRTICITLLNNGTVYEIPENAIATLWATKPDGRTVYNDCVIQENEICYTIKNQLIAAAGDVECQIKITASDGTVIHSPTFIIRVYEKLFDESILESTNDYSALQTYCMRAEQAATGIESTATAMREAIKSVSEECNVAKETANAAVTVKECKGKGIEVKSPYSVLLLTNIRGNTDYPGIPTHLSPIDPVSLGDDYGKVEVLVSTTPALDNVIESYTFQTGVMRSVGNYADELCYKNHEMYVKRRIKSISLSSDADIEEVNMYSGSSYEGKRFAYRYPIPDAIKNPNGTWYTCTHFAHEMVPLNAVPGIDSAVQNEAGYFIFTAEMDIETFREFIDRVSVDVLYVAEEADTNWVLNETGIIRYENHDTVYIGTTDVMANAQTLTVQIPNNAFADAVMQLL